MIIRISEESAREGLQIYRDILAGRGCMCVQAGHAAEPCATSLAAARRDAIAVVDGHPELQAELREAAERVLGAYRIEGGANRVIER